MKFYHSPVDLDELPDPMNDGLENEFGFLFYHYLPIKLSRKQKEYLENNEIEIDYSETFTKEEDDRIRENFQNFKTNHFKCKDSSLAIIGFRFPWITIAELKKQLSRSGMHKIWPSLCSGLENRTAHSIQQRLSLILDEHYQEGIDEPTEEQMNVINTLKKIPKATEAQKIWNNHQIPFFFIVRHFTKFENREGRAEMDCPSKTFFDTVLKLSKVSEIEFATTLTKLNIKKIHRLFENNEIDWDKLRKVEKLKNFSEEEWMVMIEKFVDVYRQNMMETEKRGEYSKKTWLICKKIVFGQAAKFCDRVSFVRCVYKCVNPKATSLNEKDAVDGEKIQNKLAKLGLLELCASENLNDSPEYRKLMSRVELLEENVFESLNMTLTLKEKLMIYIESLMRRKNMAHGKRHNENNKSLGKLFEIVREVAKLYDDLKRRRKRNNDEEEIEAVPRKMIKVPESPIMKRLKVRVLTEEEKRNVKIVRIASQSSCSSSGDESTFFDMTESTANNSTFLRPDETVIAGGGGDCGTTTSSPEEFSSRIIEVPIREVEEKVIITPPVIPIEPTDNWLDLLG